MDKSQLLSLMDASFGRSSPPAKERLLKPNLHDVYEAQEVREAFAGLSWESVPRETLRRNGAAPQYFSDEAFIYYLPSYLTLIVLDIEYADVLVDTILDKLLMPANEDVLKQLQVSLQDPHPPAGLRDYYLNKLSTLDERLRSFAQRFARLLNEQSYCVLQFLEYLRDHCSASFDDDILQRAIERYWVIFKRATP
jgi:hypothetical protein